jgi:NADH dehydrogenase [ubiquinone] 1 alpha subcomplex assembly factor 7
MGARRHARDPADGSLGQRLKERIRRHGPLSVADYMGACLSDASGGAYACRQPIGAAGDFITAPEISQIFGELLGLWCVAVWQSMGEPAAIALAELGPGRGTLMADALRAWRRLPKFLERVSVVLVETSPVMAEAQRNTLQDAPVPLRWCADLSQLPSGPLILLANEFIDALPVRQLVRRGDVWCERVVTLDAGGAFAFAKGEAVSDVNLPAAPDGAILETRPAVTELLSVLASRAPLAALFIDYGHDETSFGDTLQAVAGHRFADPLGAPGEADLSAHVDFAALRRQAEALGLHCYGPMLQGAFLLKLGLAARRDRLLQHATPEQRAAITSSTTRLVDPRQMGALFKALALTSHGLPPPPPFHPGI